MFGTHPFARVRRQVVPTVLAVVALVAGTVALLPPNLGRSSLPLAAPSRRPVLTPRRAPALLAQFVADSRLRASLDQILDDPRLGPGRSRSCLLVEEETGRSQRPIYTRRPDQPLLPASNVKLLTAAAVLERLGPQLRLRTSVYAGPSDVPGDAVIDDNLWLIGAGDPLLATSDYVASLEASLQRQPQLRTPLEELANRVVAADIREIRGAVIGDESRYDTQRYLPTWRPEYLAQAQVGPASALTVNDNFSQWHPAKVASSSPATTAAAVLTELLRQRGVAVGAPASEGRAPPGPRVVASVDSPPMGEIVGQMLRESDNLTAELLVKELGRRFGGSGSTVAGLKVMRSTLANQGFDLTGLIAHDGSGLDRGDRATCRLLLDVLDKVGQKSWVARGLPVAGEDGTLADRFRGSPVMGRLRAKTGSLHGVAGLSGWIDIARINSTDKKRTLVFAFLINDLSHSPAPSRAVQERIATALAAYPKAPPPTELAP